MYAQVSPQNSFAPKQFRAKTVSLKNCKNNYLKLIAANGGLSAQFMGGFVFVCSHSNLGRGEELGLIPDEHAFTKVATNNECCDSGNNRHKRNR